jgi:starch synthase
VAEESVAQAKKFIDEKDAEGLRKWFFSLPKSISETSVYRKTWLWIIYSSAETQQLLLIRKQDVSRQDILNDLKISQAEAEAMLKGSVDEADEQDFVKRIVVGAMDARQAYPGTLRHVVAKNMAKGHLRDFIEKCYNRGIAKDEPYAIFNGIHSPQYEGELSIEIGLLSDSDVKNFFDALTTHLVSSPTKKEKDLIRVSSAATKELRKLLDLVDKAAWNNKAFILQGILENVPQRATGKVLSMFNKAVLSTEGLNIEWFVKENIDIHEVLDRANIALIIPDADAFDREMAFVDPDNHAIYLVKDPAKVDYKTLRSMLVHYALELATYQKADGLGVDVTKEITTKIHNVAHKALQLDKKGDAYNILHVSPEVGPFSKSGGLGDVSEGLPRAWAQLGHNSIVVTLLYDSIDREKFDIRNTGIIVNVPVGGRIEKGYVFTTTIENTIYYLVYHPLYSKKLYLGTELGNYDKQYELIHKIVYARIGRHVPIHELPVFMQQLCFEQAIFLSMAPLEIAKAIHIKADVFHTNDWQTALLMVLAKTHLNFKSDPIIADALDAYTIHNLRYQGRFNKHLLPLSGIDWREFTMDKLEYYDDINLMKAGITYSDLCTTVSPNYRNEVLRPEFSEGLGGTLAAAQHKFFGIINGLDYKVFNPSTDQYLAKNYSSKNAREGKAENKKEITGLLRKESGNQDLSIDPDGTLLGFVGRVTDQKGLRLFAETVGGILRENPKVQILLAGKPDLSSFWHVEELKRKEKEYFNRLILVPQFISEKLARNVYAAADIFLGPSEFEPCGLFQLISYRYGTVPVVFKTGGLADTVNDYRNPQDVAGAGRGFVFEHYTSESFYLKVQQAIDLKTKEQGKWWKMVTGNMEKDFSWDGPAKEYVELFGRFLEAKRNGGKISSAIVETVKEGEKVLALVARTGGEIAGKFIPLTDDPNLLLQIAINQGKKGDVGKTVHYHTPALGQTLPRQEILYVISGQIKALIYTVRGKFVEEKLWSFPLRVIYIADKVSPELF